MCSRYYIDSGIEDELEKVVSDADQQSGQNCFTGDICHKRIVSGHTQ